MTITAQKTPVASAVSVAVATATTGLEKMIPNSVEVTLTSGETVQVSPFKVKSLSAVISTVAPLYAQFVSAKSAQKIDLSSLMVDSLPEVLRFVAVSLERTEEWVGELQVDDLADLFFTVVEVNADFFIKRVLPGLMGRVGKLTQTLSTATAQSQT